MRATAINQRQFVIFLQEDHHAVGEFDALRLLRMESGQRRDRDLLPVASLALRRSGAAQIQDGSDETSSK